MINQGMIDQGAQALAERIGKLNADLFRGAAEAVLRAALSNKPSPGDRTLTGETARGEACDLAPPPSTHMSREAAMRKAGQVVIDDLIDRGGWCIASDDDLADYMTRIVDACVRAATTEGQANG